MKKVGYLGPIGSYSEMAAEYLKPEVYFSPQETITEVIRKVNDGNLDFGVVPIENSIQGSVVETIDGLYQNKLFIEKELVVPINPLTSTLSELSIKSLMILPSVKTLSTSCSIPSFLKTTL